MFQEHHIVKYLMVLDSVVDNLRSEGCRSCFFIVQMQTAKVSRILLVGYIVETKNNSILNVRGSRRIGHNHRNIVVTANR